ncbi:phospholipase B1, membrane-associated isoform X1 [Takifugu rubripes]|uniref:Phospholipase B1, membrane-associated n=1 Tax=Takifugu rubripes TaxID=31033 RepID=A0A674PQC6_TAKRU|nr:phospholipase B1, membrane-associated isoform X1 [Takifugu rubripes]
MDYRFIFLFLTIGSCTHNTVVAEDRENEQATETSETRTYLRILCSPVESLSSPSSVHAITPADISAVYLMGIPLSHRRESSTVLTGVKEMMSMFNPEVTVQHVDQMAVQPRNLLDEVEKLSMSVSQQLQMAEWRLVLLFVPADSTCACSPAVAADISSAVQETEAALQLLQKRLHHTLVHVAVWSTSPQQDSKCKCLEGKYITERLQRATFLQSLQNSLSRVLKNPKWASKMDFAAVLQPAPLILEHNSADHLALQLWRNLLHPSLSLPEDMDSSASFPCPTQKWPFLRTRNNSPADEQKGSSTLADPDMGTEVPCSDRTPSPTTPTSVNELRPADIKVVAAVGDSLTAANGVGAKTDNILLVIDEYRGLSWSIGGDENITSVTTLPNILREFNPSVTGFSKGICNETSPNAFLNQAVPGAKSGDMPQQVRTLVDIMKNDARIDFHNDWKVITMFIGGNDICDFCTDSIFFSPKNVVSRIQQALDLLHREVPRAIVNLVELLNVVPLRDLHKDTTLGCPTWFVNLICPCILKPKDGSAELQKVNDVSKAYQHTMRQLIDSGRYDTHENFSVVLQPFMRDIYLPRLQDGRPDRSYFAPDCFHLSQKAHTLMARALWNNMLEPVGNKTFTQDFEADIDLKCPSKTSPFFRTAVNSNYTFPGPLPTTTPPTHWGSDFSCTNMAPSDSVPTSVHRLRPADIKVIAALGDSITTGFGAKAKNLLQLRTEYKGVSWSIGGDEALETVTTLPNILRKFNPKIKGMSKGLKESGFNFAVSGAKVAGIPNQVRRLIDTLKSDPTVDFQNDWKLVTLFIGGNDLCQFCNDRASMSPQNYSLHMMTSLDMLYREVPRTIVHVLEVLEVEGLRKIKRDSLGCSVLQKYVCPCFLLAGENSLELAEAKRFNRELQIKTENLVYGGRYEDKEDFAVVVQPFLKNTVVPLNADSKPDTTYFSVDCFHFSERGHADMAAAMWNNMLEPVGKKQTYNDFANARNTIKCPTEEHPYIFTKVNSFLPSTTAAPGTVSTAPSESSTASATQSTGQPLPADCTNTVPVWLTAVLAVTGLLTGCVVTWLLLSCRAKRNKRLMTSAVELRGTLF